MIKVYGSLCFGSNMISNEIIIHIGKQTLYNITGTKDLNSKQSKEKIEELIKENMFVKVNRVGDIENKGDGAIRINKDILKRT